MWSSEARRRSELASIHFQCIRQQRRCEMRGKGIGQSEHRGEAGAEQARAQYPGFHIDTGTRHGANSLTWRYRFEVAQQLHDIGRKFLGILVGAAKRTRGGLIGAGSASEAEIDAPGIQASQRAELLGNLQRSMVRQHDAARTDADVRRTTGHMADQHRCCSAGDSRHVVMFGEPVAAVAESFGIACKIQRIGESLRSVAAFGDGRKIENGKWNHGGVLVEHPTKRRIGLHASRTRLKSYTVVICPDAEPGRCTHTRPDPTRPDVVIVDVREGCKIHEMEAMGEDASPEGEFDRQLRFLLHTVKLRSL